MQSLETLRKNIDIKNTDFGLSFSSQIWQKPWFSKIWKLSKVCLFLAGSLLLVFTFKYWSFCPLFTTKESLSPLCRICRVSNTPGRPGETAFNKKCEPRAIQPIIRKLLNPIWSVCGKLLPCELYYRWKSATGTNLVHQIANSNTIILSSENVQKVYSRPDLLGFETPANILAHTDKIGLRKTV